MDWIDVLTTGNATIQVPKPAVPKVRKSIVQRHCNTGHNLVTSTPIKAQNGVLHRTSSTAKTPFAQYRMEDGDQSTASSCSVRTAHSINEQPPNQINSSHNSFEISKQVIEPIVKSFRRTKDNSVDTTNKVLCDIGLNKSNRRSGQRGSLETGLYTDGRSKNGGTENVVQNNNNSDKPSTSIQNGQLCKIVNHDDNEYEIVFETNTKRKSGGGNRGRINAAPCYNTPSEEDVDEIEVRNTVSKSKANQNYLLKSSKHSRSGKYENELLQEASPTSSSESRNDIYQQNNKYSSKKLIIYSVTSSDETQKKGFRNNVQTNGRSKKNSETDTLTRNARVRCNHKNVSHNITKSSDQSKLNKIMDERVNDKRYNNHFKIKKLVIGRGSSSSDGDIDMRNFIKPHVPRKMTKTFRDNKSRFRSNSKIVRCRSSSSSDDGLNNVDMRKDNSSKSSRRNGINTLLLTVANKSIQCNSIPLFSDENVNLAIAQPNTNTKRKLKGRVRQCVGPKEQGTMANESFSDENVYEATAQPNINTKSKGKNRVRECVGLKQQQNVTDESFSDQNVNIEIIQPNTNIRGKGKSSSKVREYVGPKQKRRVDLESSYASKSIQTDGLIYRTIVPESNGTKSVHQIAANKTSRGTEVPSFDESCNEGNDMMAAVNNIDSSDSTAKRVHSQVQVLLEEWPSSDANTKHSSTVNINFLTPRNNPRNNGILKMMGPPTAVMDCAGSSPQNGHLIVETENHHEYTQTNIDKSLVHIQQPLVSHVKRTLLSKDKKSTLEPKNILVQRNVLLLPPKDQLHNSTSKTSNVQLESETLNKETQRISYSRHNNTPSKDIDEMELEVGNYVGDAVMCRKLLQNDEQDDISKDRSNVTSILYVENTKMSNTHNSLLYKRLDFISSKENVDEVRVEIENQEIDDIRRLSKNNIEQDTINKQNNKVTHGLGQALNTNNEDNYTKLSTRQSTTRSNNKNHVLAEIDNNVLVDIKNISKNNMKDDTTNQQNNKLTQKVGPVKDSNIKDNYTKSTRSRTTRRSNKNPVQAQTGNQVMDNISRLSQNIMEDDPTIQQNNKVIHELGQAESTHIEVNYSKLTIRQSTSRSNDKNTVEVADNMGELSPNSMEDDAANKSNKMIPNPGQAECTKVEDTTPRQNSTRSNNKNSEAMRNQEEYSCIAQTEESGKIKNLNKSPLQSSKYKDETLCSISTRNSMGETKLRNDSFQKNRAYISIERNAALEGILHAQQHNSQPKDANNVQTKVQATKELSTNNVGDDFNFVKPLPKRPAKKQYKKRQNKLESSGGSADTTQTLRRSTRQRTAVKFTQIIFECNEKYIKALASYSNTHMYKSGLDLNITMESSFKRSSIRKRNVTANKENVPSDSLEETTTKRKPRTQAKTSPHKIPPAVEKKGRGRKKRVLDEMAAIQEEAAPSATQTEGASTSKKTSARGRKKGMTIQSKEDINVGVTDLELPPIMEDVSTEITAKSPEHNNKDLVEHDLNRSDVGTKRRLSSNDGLNRSDHIEYFVDNKMEKIECFKRTQEYIDSQDDSVKMAGGLQYNNSCGGRLKINGTGKKSKNVLRDSYMHLTVIKGRCKVIIQEVYQILEVGHDAVVPMGATYSICNDDPNETLEVFYVTFRCEDS